MVKTNCAKRCKGTIIDKRKGVYCECIEKRLPKPSKQSVKAFPSGRIDDYWIKKEINEDGLTDEEIMEKLVKFGLDPHEVELIMLRYVDKYYMKEIVKDQGWLNINSVNHYLKKALSKLRSRKFTFR